MMEQRPDLRVVGEASDGLEAFQRAEELQPDLILLDIGLPMLNGIEAARRIRKLAPNSKILFLSMESSADIVQEAFKLGAQAYVLKSQAGGELLAAVEAVIQGNQFVSSALADHVLAHIAPAQAPDHFCDNDVLPSLAPPLTRESEIARCHAVQFYPDDESFLDGLTRFIIAALKAENAVIVVATESHRVSLLRRLQAGGVDVAAAVEQKRYIPLDVLDTLSTFMVNDLPDPVRFAKIAGDLIVEATKAAKGAHRRVAVG